MLKFSQKILFSKRNILVKEIESAGIFWNIPSMKVESSNSADMC
jgi:hypothetical protein